MVIAAPASGNGKTTVATGIMAALRAGGREVAPFKVGPDFIDPGFHCLATGRPGRNLDPNLQGERRIGPLYAHGAAGADIGVVEGVMGLFDGRIGAVAPDGVSGYGSTAHVASLIGAPVILVVDARGHSQSVGALVRGYSTFAPGTHVAGVILNQVGSDRHARILADACEGVGVPALGAVPRSDAIGVPSRHLGLMTTDALDSPDTSIAAMGETMARHLDLEAIAGLAASAPVGGPWVPGDEADAALGSNTELGPPPVIAVASGRAFGFRYPEWEEMLRALGAEIAHFDPLTDPFPTRADGLLLLGGYPEEHAAELSANTATREAVRGAVEAGLPTYAECGGLTYLGRSLDGHRMCGAVDVDFAFGRKLTLGYRDAVSLGDSLAAPAGLRFVGHEFHRTDIVGGESPAADEARGDAAWGWIDGEGGTRTEGFAGPTLHGSYLHLHPVGSPQVVARIVAGSRESRLKG